MNIILNDVGDDELMQHQTQFTTFEAVCPKCKTPRGHNTLVGMKVKHLSNTTMKVWLHCIICSSEVTMKCRVI